MVMDSDLVAQYRTIHQNSSGYGSSAGWNPTILKRFPNCTRILDYGCGKGALVGALREAGKDATGYDPAIDKWSDPSALEGDPYDLVTCIDVAEHWKPGTIKPELRRLRDLSRGPVFMVISCRPAHQILPDGRNAHLSVNEPEWWEARLREVFNPAIYRVERVRWDEANRALAVSIERATFHRHAFERVGIFGAESVNLRGKRIAVVGNGPIHAGDQQRIEESDLVVRFNDWNRRSKFRTALYGQRCDFLFTQFDSDHNPAELKAPPRDVCIAIPSPFHQDAVMDKLDGWYADSRLWMFNPYTMRHLCRDVLRLRNSDGTTHPIPTVGFQFLWQLDRWLDESYGSTVFVTGFTWHVDQEMATAGRVPIISDVFPNTYNHSYLREVKWTVENLLGRPGWDFGKLSIEALNYVKTTLETHKA